MTVKQRGPGPAGPLFAAAVQHHQAGRLAEAERLYRDLLALQPSHADGLKYLGLILLARRDWAGAAEVLVKAARHDRSGEAEVLHGVALAESGRPAEAVTAYRASLKRREHPETRVNLANALAALGRGDEAEDNFRRALRAAPSAAALAGIGHLLRGRGCNGEAIDAYRRALAIEANRLDARLGLALALAADHRPAEALPEVEAALRLAPADAAVHNALGIVLRAAGRRDESLACFQRAVELRRDFAEAWTNAGCVLKSLARPAEAVDHHLEAVRLNAGYADAHLNLGNALQAAGRMDEALAAFDTALALRPGDAQAECGRAAVLKELGRMDEAVAAYRQALAHDPGDLVAHSNLLVLLPFLSDFDGESVLAAARAVGEAYAAPLRGRPPPHHANPRDPERRLRIGYLSSNLTSHVLAPYVAPVFAAHRRDRVSVHVYAHVPNPDAVTRRMQGLADTWAFVHDLSDDEAAAKITADGIDILVDPIGHWADNRLSVFARKPAPIQVSYLCQGLTDGLAAIDYAIGDPWLNQGGAMQRYATERVVELPGGFQVTEYEQEPPIGPPPAAEAGFVTFGSFNNPAKISERSLLLWAAVMARVPTARLLIKGGLLEHPGKRALLTRRLAELGVAAERVDLVGRIPGPDHLSAHDRIDIMLDTLPFTGGRTTADALWMGVPVVTQIGETVCGRFSTSHLARIGAAELAGRCAEDYVDIAVALAADLDRLHAYRRTLRPAMKSSTLMNPAAHVADLEEAFRAMWRDWCAGPTPE